MPRRQPAEARGEEGDAEPVRRPDAHRAGNGRVDPPDARLHRQHLRFHPFCRAQKCLALRGKVAAIGPADEQAGLQRLLQRADAAAQGGVVDAEAAGGSEQLPGAGDCEEQARIVPVHGLSDFNFCTTVPYMR